MEKTTEVLDHVVIRFAGDSGDGMQLTGGQFTHTSALVGNDLATLPDFPAEIRAPAGTLYGVSAYQLHFSSYDIHTPGDQPDVLVAMNPAALVTQLPQLKRGGIIIANLDAFDAKNLELAGYAANPLEDGSLQGYRLFSLPISKATLKAVEGLGLSTKEAGRCKNFYTLGLLYWLYNRPLDMTLRWIDEKFKDKELFAKANRQALMAGYNLGDTLELFTHRYEVRPAQLAKGTYRNITGNQATALGMLAATQRTSLQGFLGSYPITPASDILHEVSRYKNFGFLTFQAEDEIAAICSSIGASYAGALGFTTTSGPGVALKTEAIGLAVMTELPLIIINVQRGGPSTGLPTKTEQADLLQAVYGRNGECPVPVIAAMTPGDCFFSVLEAARIATRYMTPVMLLTDGYLANGSEPWQIPTVDSLPDLTVHFATDPETYKPYGRDERLARPWAVPGTPGLEHRIGGLEKANITGEINYSPSNHEEMVKLRAAKVAGIANDIPDLEVFGEQSGDLLIVGWGSTFGAIRAAVEQKRQQGYSVAHAHLRHLNPLPKNTADVLRRYKRVVVAELNLGQLIMILRSEFLVDAIGWNKVQGLPFTGQEIGDRIESMLGHNN
jgi:2-oxoglutarate ferredoxin oxidoreductase subunit alpha